MSKSKEMKMNTTSIIIDIIGIISCLCLVFAYYDSLVVLSGWLTASFWAANSLLHDISDRFQIR